MNSDIGFDSPDKPGPSKKPPLQRISNKVSLTHEEAQGNNNKNLKGLQLQLLEKSIQTGDSLRSSLIPENPTVSGGAQFVQNNYQARSQETDGLNADDYIPETQEEPSVHEEQQRNTIVNEMRIDEISLPPPTMLPPPPPPPPPSVSSTSTTGSQADAEVIAPEVPNDGGGEVQRPRSKRRYQKRTKVSVNEIPPDNVEPDSSKLNILVQY